MEGALAQPAEAPVMPPEDTETVMEPSRAVRLQLAAVDGDEKARASAERVAIIMSRVGVSESPERSRVRLRWFPPLFRRGTSYG